MEGTWKWVLELGTVCWVRSVSSVRMGHISFHRSSEGDRHGHVYLGKNFTNFPGYVQRQREHICEHFWKHKNVPGSRFSLQMHKNSTADTYILLQAKPFLRNKQASPQPSRGRSPEAKTLPAYDIRQNQIRGPVPAVSQRWAGLPAFSRSLSPEGLKKLTKQSPIRGGSDNF